MADNGNDQQPPEEQQQQQPGGINANQGTAYLGLNLNSVQRQFRPGQLSYALNAVVEGADGNSITYQNEQGNTLCVTFPAGYKVIGNHSIYERSKHLFWLANPTTGGSEIGYIVANQCNYITLVNQACLNFSINHPILKAYHKITNCGTEVYWTDVYNNRRYIDIDNLPYATQASNNSSNPCDQKILTTIDCNKLNVQPDFDIPQITYKEVNSEGNLVSGTYQFALQYSNSLGDPYTAYYSVTNGVPIIDPFKVGPDFNYPTTKSIRLTISNIDTSGIYDYFNLAVIKTINNITSVDLVGTYEIRSNTQDVLYTGLSKANVSLTIDDIFQKYAFFDKAEDLTVIHDILVWDGLTTNERISYQQIFSALTLQWQTYKIPPSQKGYADPLIAANYTGYTRDEVYQFSGVIMLKNGYQSDEFPLIGRASVPSDLVYIDNGDVFNDDNQCTPETTLPRWQVYNTAVKKGFSPEFLIGGADSCYIGPYEYGDFAYWESTEEYPCNKAIWGTLAGTKIRHFKFPDNLVTNHYDNDGNIYPLGVRIDIQQLQDLISHSSLTQDQKDNIAGIKIVRADRAGNRSVVGKGLIYNVGSYNKAATSFYYPNYPYNDVRPDPFIKITPPSLAGGTITSDNTHVFNDKDTESTLYDNVIPADTMVNDGDLVAATYTGVFHGPNIKRRIKYTVSGVVVFDSGIISDAYIDTWGLVINIHRTSISVLTAECALTVSNPYTFYRYTNTKDIVDPSFGSPIEIVLTGQDVDSVTALSNDIEGDTSRVVYTSAIKVTSSTDLLSGFASTDSLQRFTFHSPDTSFYQPTPGNILKLENVAYGYTRGHFVEVLNHAKYKFPSLGSYLSSLAIGVIVGFASGLYGTSDQPFDGSAAFTTFQLLNDLIYKLIPRKNFAYQYNSIGYYNNSAPLPNDTGNKLRQLDIATYLPPGIQGVGDKFSVNNHQREGSIYLRTTLPIPSQEDIEGVPSDNSRSTLSQVGSCNSQDNIFQRNISAYYASIKRPNSDQYGQIGSQPFVDTGFYFPIQETFLSLDDRYKTIFGGDTYINKFSLKRKFPFFLDNRVNPQGNTIFPDDSDIFYDILGNVGYPTYWFSTDITQGDGGNFNIGSIFGVKVHNFDCNGNNFFYDSGKIYLFAYGLPTFYVESAVNVDYRQASNSLEGDFYPHVGSDIPDSWLQESKVSIVNDNSYIYNKGFSKQNDENVFTTLPIDFIPGQQCSQNYPNKAIFSDKQENVLNYKKNSWLIYRPASFFDFPLNFGKLISLEGIENREVIARFENKSLLYNAMLTMNTSSPQQAYLGQADLFAGSPPISFVESAAGYAGTQNKFFLMTPFGHLTTDAKRGQLFLIGGRQYMGGRSLEEISGPKFFASQFFMENLSFKILDAFPTYPTDNAFNGVGYTGVYDPRYKRIIFTKIDYEVTDPTLTWNPATGLFHTIGGQTVHLGDPGYFCNRSFTLSFSFISGSWVSFHSYIPSFYLNDVKQFYSGDNALGELWEHNISNTTYNNLYGSIVPYILEYPFAYKYQDEILQNVKDYTKVFKYTNDLKALVEVNDVFFNQAILSNDQQTSGIRNLVVGIKGNLQQKLQYPKHNDSSIDILVTKSNSFYNYNSIWDVVKDKSIPIYGRSCTSYSNDRVLNQSNMDYGSRSFKKAPLMAKDVKIRHILNNTSDYKLISQFIVAPSQTSYK